MYDLNQIKKQTLANFKCQACGNCCSIPGGFVYLQPEDQAPIAKLLGLTEEEFIKKYVKEKNGFLQLSTPEHNPKCFLENKKCQIYSARPKDCRTYPDWDYIWRNQATIEEEIKLCPGLRKAYALS